MSSCMSCIAGRFFTAEPQWRPGGVEPEACKILDFFLRKMIELTYAQEKDTRPEEVNGVKVSQYVIDGGQWKAWMESAFL